MIMLNLIKNEAYKLIMSKKIYVFMLIIFVYNFLPSLENIMGTLDEAEVIINGQNTAFYMLNFMIANILSIFVIVAIADMITGEYINGTLKLPLLQPVSRMKLLVAKMGALAITLMGLMFFSLILSYVMGTAIFGWGDQFIYQEPNQSSQGPVIYSTVEGIVITFASYLLSMFPLLAFGMLILFLALFLNSIGATVGISVGLVIFLSILAEAVEPIYPYLIIHGFSLFKILFVSQDVNFFITSAILTGIYGLSFGLASAYLFKKKDLLY